MIGAHPPAEPTLAEIKDENDLARVKDESALRKLHGDPDGRHFLKWLMEVTALEGPSGNPHREGQRSIGLAFKLLCDSAGTALYAELVAEMTAERTK